MQGVFFMCRREQLHGTCLCCFGIGLLTGCWIEGQFWQICLGICLIGAGSLVLLKK